MIAQPLGKSSFHPVNLQVFDFQQGQGDPPGREIRCSSRWFLSKHPFYVQYRDRAQAKGTDWKHIKCFYEILVFFCSTESSILPVLPHPAREDPPRQIWIPISLLPRRLFFFWSKSQAFRLRSCNSCITVFFQTIPSLSKTPKTICAFSATESWFTRWKHWNTLAPVAQNVSRN